MPPQLSSLAWAKLENSKPPHSTLEAISEYRVIIGSGSFDAWSTPDPPQCNPHSKRSPGRRSPETAVLELNKPRPALIPNEAHCLERDKMCAP
jgi:hypothetical protein